MTFIFFFSIREKGMCVGGLARRKAGRMLRSRQCAFFHYLVNGVTSVPSELPVQMKGPHRGSRVYQTAREAAALQSLLGKGQDHSF